MPRCIKCGNEINGVYAELVFNVYAKNEEYQEFADICPACYMKLVAPAFYHQSSVLSSLVETQKPCTVILHTTRVKGEDNGQDDKV